MIRKTSVATAMMALAIFGYADALKAETQPAEQAAEMLARAQANEVKCHYLSRDQKDELSKLVAKAELALATKESVDATKETMHRGRSAGAEATCSADEKQSVLTMVNNFKDPTIGQSIAVKPEAPKIAVAPTPMPPIEIQKPVMPVVAAVEPAEPKPLSHMVPDDSALQRYATLAAAYYKATRCGTGDLGSMYHSIISLHTRVMANHPASVVAAALHLAKAKSASGACL